MTKRLLSLLLVCALLIGAFAGCATKTDGITGKNLPAIGKVVNGFKVVAHDPIEYLSAMAVRMEHEKTGAQLIYYACDDTERSFSIGFRTPVNNDKGVPHVFEHSVLSGSEKYPDPSLFFTMISKTYHTYLNALTGMSCTVYPCASLSEEQLYRFVDFYMNGVFKPLVITDEHAMMREAYRYEMADKDAPITLNGTVYSEMQGALTAESMAQYNFMKLLYPGSTHSSITGGLPADIPTMTQQDLIDFHKTYYNPSNALITLYGDLDYERFLEYIDNFFAEYEKKDVVIEDSGYKPVTGHVEGRYEIPMGLDSEAKTILHYGFPLRGATQEEVFLINVAASTMTNPDAPLDKLRQEKLPGGMVSVNVEMDTAEPSLIFTGMGLTEADKDTFREVVDEAIARIIEQGFDDDSLRNTAKKVVYNLDMQAENPNCGVNIGVTATMNWGQTSNIDSYLIDFDAISKLLDYVDQKAYDAAFKKYMSAPPASALSVSVAVPGLLEERAAETQQRLADMKAKMTHEEIDALVAKTADFNEWTKKNTETSMIDQMIAVDVASLPEEAQRFTATDTTADGMRVVSSVVEGGDITTFEIYLDASAVPMDLLYEYQLLSNFMFNVATENYTREQLNTALGSVAFQYTNSTASLKTEGDGYRPVNRISMTVMDEDIAPAFELLREVLFNSDFTDAAYIRDAISQQLMGNVMMMNMMPDVVAASTLGAMLSDKSNYGELCTGDGYSEFCLKVSQMSDEEIVALAERIKQARDIILNSQDFLLTCVGNEAAIAEATEQAKALCAELDSSGRVPFDYTPYLPEWPDSVAVIVDGTMQYNYVGLNMEDTGFEMNGKFLAFSTLVYETLIEQLRFDGGAYGAGCGLDEETAYLSSYRDPNLAKTYDRYHELADVLRTKEYAQDALDGYISAAYTSLAKPIGPRTGAAQAVKDILEGKDTFGNHARWMRELKQFKIEDVRTYADLIETLAENGKIVTAGGTAAVNENKDMFDLVKTLPKSE